MPEVVGDAALLVDPLSIDDIAQAIVDVVSDPSLANRLAVAGRRIAARFNMEAMVHSFCGVYNNLVQSNQ
jgi:alpha-1,3-rhamnosyl/mannosyltransferase